MNSKVKFGPLTVTIRGTLGWLAAGSIHQATAYYKKIAEWRLHHHEQ